LEKPIQEPTGRDPGAGAPRRWSQALSTAMRPGASSRSQAAISSSVRKQPWHQPRGPMLQTLMHGELGTVALIRKRAAGGQAPG
jgi:hypothetical protein